MARSKKGEEKQRADFLAALASHASITKACETTGVPRRTAYNWRNSDPLFAQAWEDALDLGTDALEDEAIRRAYHGTEKPVYQGGKKVGSVTEFSDTLLIFMLKAKRPDVYKERSQQDINMTHHIANLADDEIDKEIADAMKPEDRPTSH